MPITTLDQLRDDVGRELSTFITAQAPVVDAVDPDCRELTGAITDLVSGGKRLRASFAAAGWSATADPGVDHTPVVRAGAAFELFQAAALIHDDLIDNSDIRRGRPATHRRIQEWHRGRGCTGDPERFGRAGALLAGDLSLCWARQLVGLAATQLPPERAVQTLRTWDAMSSQLMGGQFLDLLNQVRPPGPDALQQARRVLAYKTVQYSVVKPLVIGATMAGATDATLDTLIRYGTPLGEAFQLRDDLLGVFGDPERTGKPAGDDLREGKRTVLLALTRAGCGDAEREQLAALLGRPDLDDDQIARLRAIITGSGAVAEVETVISTLEDQALAVLAEDTISAPSRDLLQELAVSAVRRTA